MIVNNVISAPLVNEVEVVESVAQLESDVVVANVVTDPVLVTGRVELRVEQVVAPVTVNRGDVRAPIMTSDQIVDALIGISSGSTPPTGALALVKEDVSHLVDGVNATFSHPGVSSPVMVFRNGNLDTASIVGNSVVLDSIPQVGDVVEIVGTV